MSSFERPPAAAGAAVGRGAALGRIGTAAIGAIGAIGAMGAAIGSGAGHAGCAVGAHVDGGHAALLAGVIRLPSRSSSDGAAGGGGGCGGGGGGCDRCDGCCGTEAADVDAAEAP